MPRSKRMKRLRYLRQLRHENNNLIVRTMNVRAFVQTSVFENLDKLEQDLILRQYAVMTQYSGILLQRIAISEQKIEHNPVIAPKRKQKENGSVTEI